MSFYQIVLFTLFFLIATAMVLDRNVAEYFNLKLQLAAINLKRWYLMAKLHPKNPLTNLMMEIRMRKLLKEIKEQHEQSDIRD